MREGPIGPEGESGQGAVKMQPPEAGRRQALAGTGAAAVGKFNPPGAGPDPRGDQSKRRLGKLHEPAPVGVPGRDEFACQTGRAGLLAPDGLALPQLPARLGKIERRDRGQGAAAGPGERRGQEKRRQRPACAGGDRSLLILPTKTSSLLCA